MSSKELKVCTFFTILIWVNLGFGSSQFVPAVPPVGTVNAPPYDPSILGILTTVLNTRLTNLTSYMSEIINNQSNFCIKDPQADWNQAFNFSTDLTFMASCIQKSPDVQGRLCTAAEMKFYLENFIISGGTSSEPNRNCNLTSWVNGCEPGWACSVGDSQEVDFENSRVIPARTLNCETCCEGFFCPRSLTCMIPCPLGSYCPLATLNKTNGICEPYTYQLPPEHPNHTCGGANIWAAVNSGKELFCSEGSYCPTNTQKQLCSSGHYCRLGSTSEKPCFKLTSCDSNTTNQNIHAYGIMLIAALITLLLIIYNCSDQVLITRERRLAKSRDRAAKSARETAQARQRWKVAKDAAKKHATGLQAQLSRTFSRRKYVTHSEELKIISQAEHDSYINVYPSSSSTSLPSSVPSEGKHKEPNDPMRRMHEIEDEPESDRESSFGTGHEFEDESAGNEGLKHGTRDKNYKKKILKPKHMHTRTQIFKYAYSQLEKEKAMQKEAKNLTFSGIISKATNPEVKKRPLIEIYFKDLTLTLKAKKKHLLRCITGKINPGRITAVMGPSGAGKTTFLSALAGKTIGCKVNGLILINGKNRSIHSYKKIIGFVPQDDIVHGNLTVEENLWFSANCRLSADLSKPDKVLIVERVIEALGLQSVRDSLVGTVEKRGISGGQRKRVNVGLEMVMEPSLLILDEPTSGLDSSSSQLLLKALRREALEGVNICMVVHQPSYALFKMFDDLVLLAKGGFTVYHGAVNKVEEYFANLGIIIPDRVNPPDYFIDILEGIVKPSGSSAVDYKELPVRWMLHNGYPVPSDMQHTAAAVAMSPVNVSPVNGPNSAGAGMEEQSFAGELWQDVKSNVAHHHDKIRLNFLTSKDLANRRTPGIFHQYRYFLGRVGKQRLREARVQAMDYLILLLAGACLGALAKVSDETFGAGGYTYTVIAVSLLCKIAALRTFSQDKLEHWRESASGMSSLAYFLAKDTVDHFNTVIKPVVYLSMFYFFTNPRSSFADNYIVLLCLVYCVTGIAYAFTIFFEPGAAQLWSVLLPVVFTLIATKPQGGTMLKIIAKMGYPRWALEAFVISNAEKYYGVWLITRCGALQRSGYNLHDWNLCLCILMLFGVVSRIIAFIFMVLFQRK